MLNLTLILVIVFTLVLFPVGKGLIFQINMVSGSNACPPGYTIDENGFCRSETQYGIPDNNESKDKESAEVNVEFYAMRVHEDHDVARGEGEWVISVTVANRENVEEKVILSYPNSGLGHVSEGEVIQFDKSKTTVTMPINATGDELRIYTQGYEDDGNHWYDRNDPLGSLSRTYHVSLSGGSSDTCFTETSNTGDFTLAYQIKDAMTPDTVCPLP